MNRAILHLFITATILTFQVFASAATDQDKKNALLAAYPGLFTFSGNELVWNDGTRMIWDDKKSKSPEDLVENPDLEDMFTFEYPTAAEGNLVPPKDFDPGRIRNEDFFKKLYGASAAEVSRNVTTIKWLPKVGRDILNVTQVFEIDKKLKAVSAEIEALPSQFHKYAQTPAGGFNWRVIAKSTKLSVHSFGAAVDINTRFADYWGWVKTPPGELIAYDNQIPLEIVAIFEKYGFIWGGRWYHNDSMHFEYRPELLDLAQ